MHRLFGNRSRPAASLFAVALVLATAVVGWSEESLTVNAEPGAADSGAAEGGPGSADLDELASWMTGSFTSAAQAEEDAEVSAVELHLAAIWQDRNDGPWRYLEQAVPEFPEHPYRQRVLQLREPSTGLFELRVWTLANPQTAVGAWRLHDPLAGFEPDDLELREGCSILLRRRGDTFEGSTLATLCSSTLRGAVYATSQVVVTADGMVSWDRGYDADGRQVWGATEGGTVFDRIVAAAPDGASDSVHDNGSEGKIEDPGGVNPASGLDEP